MHRLLSILQLLPAELKNILVTEIHEYGMIPEEIRIRLGETVCMRFANGDYFSQSGAVTAAQLRHLMMNATNGAFHTAVETMENGYIALPSGGRMGICGKGEKGLRNIRCISSVCIRIPRQVIGCADSLYAELTSNGFENTLIIAPPGIGKTTLLRELIRKLSNNGYYVCVADERGEISGRQGTAEGFDLGTRCDVCVGIPKQQAAMMMLRSMGPHILAMDEITALKDLETMTEAIGCGVGLLTTMHGEGIASVKKPAFRAIYDSRAFRHAVIIRAEQGKRVYHVEEIA